MDLDVGIGGSTDPFASGLKGRGKIHVRIQQRNGRCESGARIAQARARARAPRARAFPLR